MQFACGYTKSQLIPKFKYESGLIPAFYYVSVDLHPNQMQAKFSLLDDALFYVSKY